MNNMMYMIDAGTVIKRYWSKGVAYAYDSDSYTLVSNYRTTQIPSTDIRNETYVFTGDEKFLYWTVPIGMVRIYTDYV